jgi:N-methylhydantoinase A
MATAVQAPDPIALCEIAARLRAAKIKAVAVSFLNAYRNPANETLAKRILAEELPGIFVTTGAGLSPEWSEYECTSTAPANAYVGSRVSEYMGLFDKRFRAQSFPGAFYMMGSNGAAVPERAGLVSWLSRGLNRPHCEYEVRQSKPALKRRGA